MSIITGLSGNEIFCLNQKGYKPGNIVVGNSVHSLGLFGTIGSSFQSVLGGEIEQVTRLIEEGRETALKKMVAEATAHGASGITGVTSEIIFHAGNLEFLSIGSVVHAEQSNPLFSSSADGQELFAQMDAGYHPVCFAFGNVAYSVGVTRGIIGGLKTFRRGEIKEYSDMFNHTRHLALERIIAHARENNANAVLGIKTTILPFTAMCEMIMMGTASTHAEIASAFPGQVVTSDLTNLEMWNLANMGYVPMKLLLGTSVYSLGFVGGVTSKLKSLVRGEISELTQLIYEARENAIGIIKKEADAMGADDVVGVKTYVYQLGNGLIEFLAIGTAVKKSDAAKTKSNQLPPQAIIVDQDTFYDSTQGGIQINLNKGTQTSFLGTILSWIVIFIGVFIYFFYKFHS